jgi:hypothetical protein
MRNEFRQLLEDSQSNFMGLVVDAVEDGSGRRVPALRPDRRRPRRGSWEIWQANQMDAESQTAFVEALVKGVSYLSVWDRATTTRRSPSRIPARRSSGTSPAATTGSAPPRSRSGRTTGHRHARANVYLPDGIYKFEEKASRPDKSALSSNAPAEAVERASWEQLPDAAGFVANPDRHRPDRSAPQPAALLDEGESELADIFRSRTRSTGSCSCSHWPATSARTSSGGRSA